MRVQLITATIILLIAVTSACRSKCVCTKPDGSDDCSVEVDDLYDDQDCADWCWARACTGLTSVILGPGLRPRSKCRIHSGYCNKHTKLEDCSKNGHNDCPFDEAGDCRYIEGPPPQYPSMVEVE